MSTDSILNHLETHLHWLKRQGLQHVVLDGARISTPDPSPSLENNLMPAIETPLPEVQEVQQVQAEQVVESTNMTEVEKTPADSQTLEELRQCYSDCMRCPLGATRTNFVFSDGNPNARLMFVGEGPGADEDAQGIPFVGRSGQLLTRMIQSLGVDRTDIYIANVVKCRPPENRNPTPKEMSLCSPILKRQIELVNPRVLITLGNVPKQVLAPDAPGITKAHGNVYQYENWPVFPTFHPAYLLRSPSVMETAWEDFQKIRKLYLTQ